MNLEATLMRLAADPDSGANLSRVGFFLVDFEAGFAVPSQLLRDLGYTERDLLEADWSAHVHPDDVHAGAGWKMPEAEAMFHAEYRVRDRKSNDWVWIQSRGAVFRQAGTVVVGIEDDITVRKAAESLLHQHLHDAEAIFQQAESLRVAGLLANSSPDGEKTAELVLGHAQGLLRFEAAVVSKSVGSSFQEFGQKGEFLQALIAHPRPPEHPFWSVVSGKSPLLYGDLEGPYRSWLGVPLIVQQELLGVLEFWHSEAEFFRADQIWPAMGFADSIAESLSNSQRYEALRADNQTDPLTGLLTRRQLQRSGTTLVERSHREGQPMAMLFIDIDHFKDINDRHGHLVGDAVLMTLAQLCQNVLRQEDEFYRYGGEEFVAILPGTDAAAAAVVAERLRETASSARFRGLKSPVTLSIGLVPVEAGRDVPFDDLLREADEAMYKAKQAGRDQVAASLRWAPAEL